MVFLIYCLLPPLATAHRVYIYSVSQTRVKQVTSTSFMCAHKMSQCELAVTEAWLNVTGYRIAAEMPKSHCCKGHCLSSLNVLDSFWMCVKNDSICTVAGVYFSFNSFLITKSIRMKTLSDYNTFSCPTQYAKLCTWACRDGSGNHLAQHSKHE